MSNYWKQRQRDTIYNQQLQVAQSQLANEYRRCFEATYTKLSALFDEIVESSKDGSLLISDLYKYNRYYDLMNELNKNLTKLGLKEIEIYEYNLKALYLTNSELITDEIGYYKSSIFVDENSVKKAIDAVWCQDGKHWSSRVWGNKAGLQEIIQKGLVDCIARGVSKNELIKELQDKFELRGYYEAERIARTELTYIQNQSTYDKYKEAGIEKYEFLAEIDKRTSDICREKNGKIYRMDEAEVGVNMPPLHPNCRSTILAVIE